jgi:hypothetical protein
MRKSLSGSGKREREKEKREKRRAAGEGPVAGIRRNSLESARLFATWKRSEQGRRDPLPFAGLRLKPASPALTLVSCEVSGQAGIEAPRFFKAAV